jgi:hypothetical protein
MADFVFDGRELRDRSYNVIARVEGNEIKDSSYNTVGRIEGDEIKDSSYNLIARIDGDEIKDRSYSRMGTMSDARSAIDGPGGHTLAALWIFFVR